MAKEIIEKIYSLNDELQALLQTESEQYKKATDNRENKITIKREKEDVEATEGELWEEIRVNGSECSSALLMKEKYPEVFATALLREDKNKELHDYIQKELGFSFRQMGIADYMKITEMLIDYKLNK